MRHAITPSPTVLGGKLTSNSLFSLSGLYVAWLFRHQSKGEWLSSNRTQKGQNTSSDANLFEELYKALEAPFHLIEDELLTYSLAFPLALNFIASGECLKAA
jgi:hypothetical protein